MRIVPSLLISPPLIFASLLLTACNSNDSRAVDASDSKLVEQARSTARQNGDPALASALEDQIMVDPALASQANDNAVRPTENLMPGQLPTISEPGGAKSGEYSSRQIPSENSDQNETPSSNVDSSDPSTQNQSQPVNQITLGELARIQVIKASPQPQKTSGCGGQYDMNLAWAKRLPRDIILYPQARITEAAGLGKPCNMRVVTFRSPAKYRDIIDWYHGRMRQAGYTSDYELYRGDHVLSGVRESDDSAYHFIFTPLRDGGTEVDLIANNGR